MSRLAKTPTAVIFDLDGVLLDTEPLYTTAANRVLKPWGKEIDWSLKGQIMGKHPMQSAKLVLDALGVPLTPEEYVTLRKRELRELFRGPPAMPGAEAWLATLRQAGVPLGIGTSSTRELCDLKFESHAFLREVSPIVCGDEVAERKPAPDIFLKVAELLNQTPNNCLVFEDSPAGVRAAKTAGMQVIAVAAEGLDRSLLRRADWIVSSYDEVTLQSIGY